MKYEKPTFSSAPATEAYRDGWERVFNPRCEHCGLRLREPAPSAIEHLAPPDAPHIHGHHAACLRHSHIIMEKD